MLRERKFNSVLVKPKLYRDVKNSRTFINFAGRTVRISLRVRRVCRFVCACIIIIAAANLLATVKLRVSLRYAAVSAFKSAVRVVQS